MRTVTVADATFDVMRERGLTTLFANPGSTEVPLLVGLPDDFEFVLGLHESSVVGIATGFAIGHDKPVGVLLHTTAGLGNAVGAIATARVNRAPLVIIVGQQDRRHLALEPFLTGRLDGLAGDYPLEVIQPVRAADVPSAIGRACLVAQQYRGPVLVIVPMSDWAEHADDNAIAVVDRAVIAPSGVPEEVSEIAAALDASSSRAIVAGAACDTEEGWRAVSALAEKLDAPVWIEPFGSRAGFDQTHRLYQGQIPADRPRVRAVLAGVDTLLVIGTAVLRQYPYATGPLLPEGTCAFVITDDAAQANRSPARLAVVGDVPTLVDAVTARVRASGTLRKATPSSADEFRLPVPQPGEALHAAHVFDILARNLPEDTILVEEAPSSRPALQAMVPARRPLGFVSAAMGGLGFAMPAAIGLKMALPNRPVLVVAGDGSSMYSIQSLWSAGERSAGVMFLILANGTYAVMDRLAEQRCGHSAWPRFQEVSTSTIARGYGIDSHRITDHETLTSVLTGACRSLAERVQPLLLEVVVEADAKFAP